MKPLGWQGAICFGPESNGSATFQSSSFSPYWQGLPEVDEAGRPAALLYLSGYGPAFYDNLHYWLVAGLSGGRRRLDRWLAALVDEIIEILIDDRPMFHLREHLETLTEVEVAPEEVTLLPGLRPVGSRTGYGGGERSPSEAPAPGHPKSTGPFPLTSDQRVRPKTPFLGKSPA